MTRRIGRGTIAFIVLLGTASGSALAINRAAPPVNVRVAPATGLPSTRFAVSFTAPAKSGHAGAIARRYQVSVSTAGGARGCASGISVRVPNTAAHARARVFLTPRGKWCLGTFRGRVEESQGPWCPRGAMVCPRFASSVRSIGRFTFRVRAAGTMGPPGSGGQPPGSGGQSPTFAGLVSATACTPGPQRPGETVAFTLTWKAATDPVTPAAQIVYEVFMSSTPGGENFAQPTWTTSPGVTSFTTPPVSTGGYFVVRARDQAGDEDHNTVERQGVDLCY